MSGTSQRERIQGTIVGSLRRIAPEIDPADLDPAMDLREQVDIDSMDFLNLVIAVHRELGVDIPEVDYPKLVTLAGFADYVEARLSPGQ
jgi:acyl carrier protein